MECVNTPRRWPLQPLGEVSMVNASLTGAHPLCNNTGVDASRANERNKSTFVKIHSVSIPSKTLITKSAANVQLQKSSTNGTSSKTKQILVVEDHGVAAKIAKTILSELGCEVDIAKTGKIALKLIEKNRYDLIFMDIGLPDMDGYAVTKQIRSHHLKSVAKIPIVALTAHAENDEKQRCLAVAMNMVITKPLTKKLADAVLNAFIPQR